MIEEKHSPISRALIAASKMPSHQARQVLMMICHSGMTTTKDVPQPTPGEIHYSKREKFIKRMKSSTDRVLNYARHETLRKIEKHFRDNPSITSAESGDAPSIPGQPSSLAVRLTFDKELLSSELLAALREDQEAALSTAGQQLFDEIGRDSVWRLPSQDAIQFVQDRANLLANVPDEVHAEIMQSIEQGLQHGESRKELMARISAAFDEIGRSRAETIANTETAAAFNYSRDKAMREAGVTHKKWLHSQSPLIKEPRPTHLEADGQVQPIDDPFDVGGVQFMRPADDSLGAGPEDIINCHCVAIPVEAPIESGGEKEGHPFRGNQYETGQTDKTKSDPLSTVPTGEAGRSPFPQSQIKTVVYHASPKDKSTGFDRIKETGTYFSDSPRTKAFGRYETKAFINIRNPYYGTEDQIDDIKLDWKFPGKTDDFSEWAHDNRVNSHNPPFKDYLSYLEDRAPNHYEDLSIVKAIKSAGYDGIIGADTHGGSRELVVFHPTQIHVISSTNTTP